MHTGTTLPALFDAPPNLRLRPLERFARCPSRRRWQRLVEQLALTRPVVGAPQQLRRGTEVGLRAERARLGGVVDEDGVLAAAFGHRPDQV